MLLYWKINVKKVKKKREKIVLKLFGPAGQPLCVRTPDLEFSWMKMMMMTSINRNEWIIDWWLSELEGCRESPWRRSWCCALCAVLLPYRSKVKAVLSQGRPIHPRHRRCWVNTKRQLSVPMTLFVPVSAGEFFCFFLFLF